MLCTYMSQEYAVGIPFPDLAVTTAAANSPGSLFTIRCATNSLFKQLGTTQSPFFDHYEQWASAACFRQS